MALNLTASYPLSETSQVAAPRRAAVALAGRLGFSEERAGRLELVVAELATNLVKHAAAGELILRGIRDELAAADPEGIEVLAVDHGPGMPDVALSRTDGHSTSGSLGHGLGAVERQSDFFQIYTQPAGTVSVARVWRTADAAAGRSRYEIGAVHVSKQGEEVCGDDWDWRMREGRTAVLLADGLGHGPAAHEASRDAVAAFRRAHEQPPASVIGDIHQAIRATRGAAVSMIAIDHARGVAQYAGVGNISAVVFHAAGTRQSLVSQNGTAGHIVPRLQEYQYPVPANAMVVLHSDGLASQWDPGAYPGTFAGNVTTSP
ncbi:MAG: SpoIIE family protein phosphatase [Acidobacteriota bacterium]